MCLGEELTAKYSKADDSDDADNAAAKIVELDGSMMEQNGGWYDGSLMKQQTEQVTRRDSPPPAGSHKIAVRVDISGLAPLLQAADRSG